MSNITKILFRRGLDAQRQTVALQLGEPGYSIDTKRMFIGDGVTLGGTPVGIVNYGIVAALSGSYVYNSAIQTNMSRAAFSLLSASNIGDIVYDQATTSLYTVSSTNTALASGTILNTLSNFAHLYNTTYINSNQFYYNGSQLTIQNGQNGQGYGIGINELNASVVAASPTLSGGSGAPLTLQVGSISNNFLTPGVGNSVKITNNSGAIADTLINQNQFLGRTNIAGSTLGAVTLTATGSVTLSANSNTIVLTSLVQNTAYVPLSGGSLSGGLSALNVNNARLTTDVVPVLPTDVVNLSYFRALCASAITTNYISSHYLALSGGTLTGPGDLMVNGAVQIGSNIGVTGTLSAGNVTISGSLSALNGLSATGIKNFASPVVGFDVTNKAYTDSKFVPISGATLTGSLYYPFTPAGSTEIANKGYVDASQTYITSSFLPLSGGTITGNLSSTNRFYTTLAPVNSAELTNKNYVDTLIVPQSPAGLIAYFASTTAPSGWIKANGAVLPIVSYQNLFNALPKQSNGNTIWWLPGDGPANFRLPDLRGQFIRGWNDGISNGNTTNTGTNPTIPTTDSGRTIGTTQADAYASHTHGINDPGHSHGVNDPGHSHTYQGFSGGVGEGGNYPLAVEYNFTTNNTSAAGTGISIGATGTGITITSTGSTETRPTNVALLACIKY